MNQFAIASTLWLLSATFVMAQQSSTKHALESTQLGATKNVHSFGKNLLCGQPSAEELADAKQRGIAVVITLRQEDEIAWDERTAAVDLGLEFHQFGFRSSDALTDEIFDRCLRILARSDESPVMLHCASANRVGAIWLAHRAVNDRLPVEKAAEEAKTVGLRSADLEARARQYIQQRLK